ncbi:MAG: hypothetical protein ACRD1T_12865, partial [Acidimicrobiia bacterium]
PVQPVETRIPAEARPAVKAVTPARSMRRWETDARNQIDAAIRRNSQPLADLIARDANEGDTRLFVADFLCEALGFNKYEELTTEYRVKGELAGYGIRVDKEVIAGIRIDKKLVAFVECSGQPRSSPPVTFGTSRRAP